ncbi:MAG TPA: DoxX family protein [Propionibacteriaceae bacterium]|nr:DoxX family protein [Propionibacteriaceae bacterium]
MKSFVRVLQDMVLLVARIAIGVVLVAHGYWRWQVQGIDTEIAHLTERGVWEPTLLAWGATVFELIGGVLLVFGLAVPVIGLVMVVQNVLVIAWLRWRNGVFQVDGGWEYNLVLAAVGLLFFGFGSGRAGLDALFRRRGPDAEYRTIDDNAPA